MEDLQKPKTEHDTDRDFFLSCHLQAPKWFYRQKNNQCVKYHVDTGTGRLRPH